MKLTEQRKVSMKNWFEVDKAGLAKILQRKGKEFVLFELIQNAWDEDGVRSVNVVFQEGAIRGSALLVVEDDAPDGFRNLTHAFTLFAESAKKGNPEKRGRFNLGEKLVLALCEDVSIESTTGAITFDKDGRHMRRHRRDAGSRITCQFKASKAELATISEQIKTLIPPNGIATTFNGERLKERRPVRRFSATLQTEIADTDGYLRPAQRETLVTVYDPAPGEIPSLYEMGIPVCETGDKFHVEVNQKIPLTLDRDSVRPGFLKTLRVAVFNETHQLLSRDEVNAPWVAQASENPNCSTAAITSLLDKRFGDKRVSYDPSDDEANKRAVSGGYVVVHGGMLSGGAWTNAKNAEAIKPAGQVTPSAKVWDGEDNPDAQNCPPIPREKWTPDMQIFEAYIRDIALNTIGKDIVVKFFNSAHMLAAASYGPGCGMAFNKLRLGNEFFSIACNRERIDALVIHELGHEYSGDHLSEQYYDALCKIASKFLAAVRKGKLN